jgi:hypothetical protein
MTVFSLFLYVYYSGSPIAATHVGNFPTMAACQAAAQSATTIVYGESGPPTNRVFVCVQANGTGTTSPN